MKGWLNRAWIYLKARPHAVIGVGIALVLAALTGGFTFSNLSNTTAQPLPNPSVSPGAVANPHGGAFGVPPPPVWSYSDLTTNAAEGRVKEVFVNATQATVTTTEGKTYIVNLPDTTATLAQQLASEGVKVTYADTTSPSWGSVANLVLPLLLLGVLVFFVFRMMKGGGIGGMGGGAMSFGQAKARVHSGATNVKFSDVAGCDEAKHELAEVVEFLSHPAKFVKMGARVPRGVLLVGPPGTGKTLLAKAVAGESASTFFSISGSEFVEMFVGVGAARIRDLFDKAKKTPRTIIFVDEVDAIGRQRGAGAMGGGGNDEREQALNQLLVEMDGMDTAAHVIVIAATNRPDILDKALLRPGRFDRLVSLDNPNLLGRQAILSVHSKDKPLALDVSLERIARQTVGLSGADLANLLNEAAILAARHEHERITNADLEEATLRVIAGPEKRSRIISEPERKIIANHETGHALVMHVLPGNDPVSRVSITSRGMALGITVSNPIEDRYLISKSEALARLAGVMGGRAAEFLVFGDITSGASNDLQKATAIAQQMVTEWGMSETLGQAVLSHGSPFSSERQVSEQVAAQIDLEVRALVEQGYQQALSILTEHRKALDLIARHLIEVENIDGVELAQLLASA